MPFDKEPVVKDAETQHEDVDNSEALAEISSDLFGQGHDGEKEIDDDRAEGEDGKSDTENKADEPPPQPDAEKEDEAPAKEEDNSKEVQALGAPKTWTKEALAEWATIPDRAKQEILKREEDFFKGIEQYKEAAEIGVAYSKVVEPYAPILEATNVNPVELFQNFASNHYLLSRGTVAQKVELAANLLNGYGIPLQPLLEFIANGGEQGLDPTVVALRKEVEDLKRNFSSRTESENNRARDTLSREIDAFAADPSHPYFDEVADDIRKLFESGMASSLAEAYEKAVYANPSTRQKEIDRLTTESASKLAEAEKARQEKRLKSTADHVKSSSKARDGTIPKGSIDDTLQETYDAIQSRG